MKYILCILLAYLIGSLSPSAMLAKIKNKNLKKESTGNLGATNTALVLGKMFGLLVMVLDIFKGFLAVKIAAWVVPEVEWFALLAGFFAIIGHCFPFYLKFKGGKGLAAFGGVILAYNPLLFLFILTTGVVLVLIINSGTVMPYYASLVLPIYAVVTSQSLPAIAVCIIMALFIMIIFIPNLKKQSKVRIVKAEIF